MSRDEGELKETRTHSGSRSELKALLLDAGHGPEKADTFLEEVAPLTRDNPADIEFGEEVRTQIRNSGGRSVVWEKTCVYAINTRTGQRINYPCSPWVSQGEVGPDDVVDISKPDRPWPN